jgi:GMP synthase-like glutamine amidotransferase
MRVHYLQHAPFEGLGSIRPWLDARSTTVTVSELFRPFCLPGLSEFDWLIVMGGPMSVSDENAYPWLAEEKQFVEKAIRSSKVVLGICLGAQLIAASQGARVYPNAEREIGWFMVEPAAEAARTAFSGIFQRPFEAFHWHGETFDLPPGAVHLARSRACRNQAFSIGDRVLGLQFHLEMTPEAAGALIEHGRNELVPGRWVQSEHELLQDPDRFRRGNETMASILECLASVTG